MYAGNSESGWRNEIINLRDNRTFRFTVYIHVCYLLLKYVFSLPVAIMYLLTITIGPILIAWFNYCILSFASEIANLLIEFASYKACELCYK